MRYCCREGIKKTGSLRNVKIVHGNSERTVDLYGIITRRGSTQQILLTDGDRIVVPPLGPTVAAAGWFRNPGIYELPYGTANISVRSLIALAGGLEVRGRYRLSELRTEPNGTNSLIELRSEIGMVRDGDLFVRNSGRRPNRAAGNPFGRFGARRTIRSRKIYEIVRPSQSAGRDRATSVFAVGYRRPSGSHHEVCFSDPILTGGCFRIPNRLRRSTAMTSCVCSHRTKLFCFRPLWQGSKQNGNN